jgi:hypothetical protein
MGSRKAPVTAMAAHEWGNPAGWAASRVAATLSKPVLSSGPMINDAISGAGSAGRIANPGHRCSAPVAMPAAMPAPALVTALIGQTH